MSYKQIGIVTASISFGIACFIFGLMWMVMAKDLAEQVRELKRDCQLVIQQE